MRALTEVGLPDGVANLVLGAGATAGAPLVDDPDVDLVSFTGGLGTGRAIMAAAAATVKRVALELGGKNPNVVFADADLPAAIDNALTAVFLDSGQVCSAGARLIVEASVHDQVVDALVERAQRDPARRTVRRRRRDRPADQRGAPGQGRAVRRRRARGRRRAALRRRPPEGAAYEDGLLLPADDPRPLRDRHAVRARGVVRAGADRRDLRGAGPRRRRGGRGQPRQRHDLRAGRGGVDRERRPRRAGREPAAPRHDLDQRLPPVRARGRVGRLQAVRQRSRARPRRARGVPRDQARLAQHPAGARRLVRRPRHPLRRRHRHEAATTT